MLKAPLKALWVFDGFGFPNKGVKDIKLARDLGFTDIVFGVVDGYDHRLRINLPNGKLGFKPGVYDYFGNHISDWDNIIGYAQNVGLKVHIMAFVYRNAKYVKDALQLLEFAARFRPKSILLNIEGPGLKGSATFEQYADFFEKLRTGLDGTGVDLGVVVIPPYPKVLDFAMKYIDYVILEGYSFWSKDGTRLWSHTFKVYPGEFQDRIIKQFIDKWGSDRLHTLVMGLANYDLEIPYNLALVKKGCMPLNQAENVERCMESIYKHDISTIAVWSLDHFRGNTAKKKELRTIFIDINSKIER